jgi:dihydrofolate reductase/thymidylate synthase
LFIKTEKSKTKMVQVIMAMNEKGGIGYKNGLPWNCKEDLALFKKKTMGKTIVIGKNTGIHLPNLPNRNVVCISRNPNSVNTSEWNNKVLVVGSDWLNTVENDVMIAGGGEIYRTVFEKQSFVKKVHLSVIKGDHECDVYFCLELLKNFIIVEKTEFTEFTHYVLEPTEYGEQQYLDLLEKIMKSGVKRLGRNGETISIFKNDMTFDLRKGFPLLTTKKMFLRGVIEEFLFFIRGDTDSSKLSEKNVRIWEGNTSEKFIMTRGLPYSRGVMGPMYGYQWRFFNAPYKLDDFGRPLVSEGGFDQLADVVNLIKNDPYSRRILMTSYNPAQSGMGVLYPCHSITIQFYVEEDFLDMFCYNRSQDAFLGIPFNIASSSLLLMTIAKLTSKIPRFFYMTMGDTHVYSNHVEQVKKQLARIPYSFPKLELPTIETLEDLGRLTPKDFVLSEYICHQQIDAVMVA